MLASLLLASQLASNLAKPTTAQLTWQDAEIGMFIHFAPNTWQDQEGDDLSTPLNAINPDKLDTDQWARVAKSMEAKYIVFVAKHIGGFCWWQTSTTDYSAKSLKWRAGRGDIMADLAKSCRKYGLKLGVYLSPMDRKFGIETGGRAPTPQKQREYESMFRTQLTELLSKYGEIFEVWFDGSLAFGVDDILKKYAPNAVVFQGPQASIRWVGNEEGYAPYPAWNGAKFDPKTWGTLTAADGNPDGDRWLPNEVDCRMRNTWFWNTKNESTVKPVDKLMEMYEQSVGHGAGLLLNNTPDTSGLIPTPDVKRSAEFGAEIKRRYGIAIADVSGKGYEVRVGPSAPSLVDAAIIMEDISQGERIRAYVLEAQVDGKWVEVSSGTAIGHKKIDRFAPVKLTTLRIKINKSIGEPIIKRLAIHRTN